MRVRSTLLPLLVAGLLVGTAACSDTDLGSGSDRVSGVEHGGEQSPGETGDDTTPPQGEESDDSDIPTIPDLPQIDEPPADDGSGDETPPADDGSGDETPPEEEEPDDGIRELTPPALPGPITEVTRLILIGDTGTGSEKQYRVSASMGEYCDARGGCHGIVMLGDNIYDKGPSSDNDPLLEAYVDLPYAALRFGAPPEEGEADERPRLPIFMSIGNHDLGGAGLDASLARHYINYAATKDWLYFPSRFWHANLGHVHIAALDTNPLAYLGTEVAEQAGVIRDMVATTDAPWTLAFGHHPYLSEGKHGNAGSYEGIPGNLVFLGGAFRTFVNDEICNKVDFYICGHDHNRQWMRSAPDVRRGVACETRFGLSGGGAKSTKLSGRGNDVSFARASEGFLAMEFYADRVVAEFFDIDGNSEWMEVFQ